MSTTNLQTEVQARIDALTYPVDAAVLLQNAVDTVGLGLDLTNIIAVHTAATDAITGVTLVDDITALNAASIALGITSKDGGGGGSSYEINDAKLINSNEDIVLDSTGATWLKTGVIEDDPLVYPDAAINKDYLLGDFKYSKLLSTTTPLDGAGSQGTTVYIADPSDVDDWDIRVYDGITGTTLYSGGIGFGYTSTNIIGVCGYSKNVYILESSANRLLRVVDGDWVATQGVAIDGLLTGLANINANCYTYSSVTGSVHKFSPTSGAVTATYPIGEIPSAMVYSTSTGSFWLRVSTDWVEYTTTFLPTGVRYSTRLNNSDTIFFSGSDMYIVSQSSDDKYADTYGTSDIVGVVSPSKVGKLSYYIKVKEG